jgi:hypothetical protein
MSGMSSSDMQVGAQQIVQVDGHKKNEGPTFGKANPIRVFFSKPRQGQALAAEGTDGSVKASDGSRCQFAAGGLELVVRPVPNFRSGIRRRSGHQTELFDF